MFILLLSLLIKEHLQQSEKLIKIADYDTSIIQSQLAIYNLKDEVISYLIKHKNDIKDNPQYPIFSIPIILSYSHIKSIINIKKYDKYDINVLNGALQDANTTNRIAKIQQLFLDNKVYGFYELGNLVKNSYTHNDKVRITDKKQLNGIMNYFISLVKEHDIYIIRDKLHFLSSSGDFLNKFIVSISVNISNLFTASEFIYDLDTNKVEYFEFTFK